jgi:ubiquinone/menaquinone biosynthesis C-methylase UbiE
MAENPDLIRAQTDVWMNWLLHERDGGDFDGQGHVRRKLACYADRILDCVAFREGMTLIDLGTGEGLVAFRAIERFGAGLNVIMTDISAPLLKRAEATARDRQVSPQCRFVMAKADGLSPVPDEAAEIVTARSVLAYVKDKAAAFAEIFRVLKPGGRVSIAEPVFRDEALAVVAMKRVLDARTTGQGNPILPLLHRWKAAQFPDEEAALMETAITNYTERDLVRFAQKAGLVDIHLEFHLDVTAARPIPWASFIDRSPHPLAPTLRAILRDRFSAAERAVFETSFRPEIEAGGYSTTEGMAFLTACKPG